MAGYSGTPLPHKLGVKEESLVLLVGAPDGFDLGPLPGGVRVHRRAAAAAYDVQLVFCPDAAALGRRFTPAKDRLPANGRLWIAWPKRSSGLATDLDENGVRDLALAEGLVDNKVAAVDDVWSGLQLVYRLRDR